MSYQPASVPFNVKDLVEFLSRELPRIAAELNKAQAQQMEIRNIAPTKPVAGLYYADGTNWDPGSGRGLYRYDPEGSATYTFIG